MENIAISPMVVPLVILIIGFLYLTYDNEWKVWYSPADDFRLGPNTLTIGIRRVGSLNIRTFHYSRLVKHHYEHTRRSIPYQQPAIYIIRFRTDFQFGSVRYIFGKPFDWGRINEDTRPRKTVNVRQSRH